jgi:hypothetical protein
VNFISADFISDYYEGGQALFRFTQKGLYVGSCVSISMPITEDMSEFHAPTGCR